MDYIHFSLHQSIDKFKSTIGKERVVIILSMQIKNDFKNFHTFSE